MDRYKWQPLQSGNRLYFALGALGAEVHRYRGAENLGLLDCFCRVILPTAALARIADNLSLEGNRSRSTGVHCRWSFSCIFASECQNQYRCDIIWVH